jgi:hypothetical protein
MSVEVRPAVRTAGTLLRRRRDVRRAARLLLQREDGRRRRRRRKMWIGLGLVRHEAAELLGVLNRHRVDDVRNRTASQTLCDVLCEAQDLAASEEVAVLAAGGVERAPVVTGGAGDAASEAELAAVA